MAVDISDYVLLIQQVLFEVVDAKDNPQLGQLQMSLLQSLQNAHSIPKALNMARQSQWKPEWATLVKARGSQLVNNVNAGVLMMYEAIHAILLKRVPHSSVWASMIVSLYASLRRRAPGVAWVKSTTVMQQSILMMSVVLVAMGFIIFNAYTQKPFGPFAQALGLHMNRVLRAFQRPEVRRIMSGGLAKFLSRLVKPLDERGRALDGGGPKDDYMTILKDFLVFFLSNAAVFTVVGIAMPKAYDMDNDLQWGEMVVFLTTIFLVFMFAVFLYGSGSFAQRALQVLEDEERTAS